MTTSLVFSHLSLKRGKYNKELSGLINLKIERDSTSTPFNDEVVPEYLRHTILLLDISGSMQGNKYATLLATIEYMFEQSKASDYFTIITFNSHTNTICKRKQLDAITKTQTLETLASITPSRGTNISAAITQVAKYLTNVRNFANVLLFTDGTPTVGVCGINELVNDFKEIYQGNYSLHTFGYGIGHNGKLLQKLANVSPDGLYYNIIDNNDVGNKFGPYMRYYNSIVCDNVCLHLIASDGANIKKLYTTLNCQSPYENTWEIELGALAIDDLKKIPFALTLDDDQGHIDVILTYCDINDKSELHQSQISYDIQFSDDDIIDEINIKDIHVEIYQYLTTKILEKILNTMGMKLDFLYAECEELINTIKSDTYVNNISEVTTFIEKLTDALENRVETKNTYAFLNETRTQRSNTLESRYTTLDDIEASTQTSDYITSSSARYLDIINSQNTTHK